MACQSRSFEKSARELRSVSDLNGELALVS